MQRVLALVCLAAAGAAVVALLVFSTADEEGPRPALQVDDGLGELLPQPVEPPTADPVPAPEPGLATAGWPDPEPDPKPSPIVHRLQRARRLPPTTVQALARRAGWIEFLETWLRLPAVRAGKAGLALVEQALGLADGPVARQNLIFLAALALPLETSTPWLRQLAASSAPADAEDALVALAFSGDARAAAEFERLATAPSPANVHIQVDWYRDHEKMARVNDAPTREVMRSYRAVEAFIRRPYFEMVSYRASRFGVLSPKGGAMLGWTDGIERSSREVVDLLEAWLHRYPGHPGSDDVAARIAWRYGREGDLLAAARWFSRAAVLPDQDVAYRCLQHFVGLCELDLDRRQVIGLSEEKGLSTPNRVFLQYVWLRRTAAEVGFDAALRELQDLAARESEGELAAAWRGRWKAPRPKGLDSGMTPLPQDDPLRRREKGTIAYPLNGHPHARSWQTGIVTSRWPRKLALEPWPEPVMLDRETLPRQFRAWETLAELERRARKAKGDARADLLYKQAAVFFHDRDVLYPAYARHTFWGSWMLRSLRDQDHRSQGGPRAALERRRFEESTLSYVRAMALFEQIERERPRWSGMDKVVFSEGLLWRRLIDYRPAKRNVYWIERAGDSHDGAIRQTVATLERVPREFPDSPLADDAAAAAAWWRRAHPRAFR